MGEFSIKRGQRIFDNAKGLAKYKKEITTCLEMTQSKANLGKTQAKAQLSKTEALNLEIPRLWDFTLCKVHRGHLLICGSYANTGAVSPQFSRVVCWAFF